MKGFCKGASVLHFSFIMVLLFIFLNIGCTTSYQINKYENRIKNSHQNLIPGVEAEESLNKIMITAKGKGIEPENGTPMQRKFMAERAAVIDGYRQLTERLSGIIINYYAESGQNTVSIDQVIVEANAFLRGAHVYSMTNSNGVANAGVRVYIEPRENKFFHGSPTTRGILGSLAGATAGGVVGGGLGALAGSFSSGATAGTALGVVGGGAYSQDPINPLDR